MLFHHAGHPLHRQGTIFLLFVPEKTASSTSQREILRDGGKKKRAAPPVQRGITPSSLPRAEPLMEGSCHAYFPDRGETSEFYSFKGRNPNHGKGQEKSSRSFNLARRRKGPLLLGERSGTFRKSGKKTNWPSAELKRKKNRSLHRGGGRPAGFGCEGERWERRNTTIISIGRCKKQEVIKKRAIPSQKRKGFSKRKGGDVLSSSGAGEGEKACTPGRGGTVLCRRKKGRGFGVSCIFSGRKGLVP